MGGSGVWSEEVSRDYHPKKRDEMGMRGRFRISSVEESGLAGPSDG